MKRIIILLAILMLFMLYGCTPSPPETASEEIVRYSWKLKGESDDNTKESNGYLNFENGKINLKIKKGDKSELELNEYYEINNESIVVNSEKYGNIIFKYKLNSGELELSFDNLGLYFVKSK